MENKFTPELIEKAKSAKTLKSCWRSPRKTALN